MHFIDIFASELEQILLLVDRYMLMVAGRIKQKAQTFGFPMFSRASLGLYWISIRVLEELLELAHIEDDFFLFVEELGR